jgi:hypothetical protein
MTWHMLDDDGRVWGAVVRGDVVRVEFVRGGAIGAAGARTLVAVVDATLAVQRELGGHLVRQISIGAPGFGFDRLGSAADVAIVIERQAARA